MTSDLDLASRVRLLLPKRGIAEKRMFGGQAFLLNGNLLCGASGRGLMARIGPDNHDAMLTEPGASAMVLNGKVFRGYVRLPPAAVRHDEQLAVWIARAVAFTKTLPEKAVKPPRPKTTVDDEIPRHPASYGRRKKGE